MLTSHRPIRRFHVVVMLWTLKESTKKRDAHAELCFCSCCHCLRHHGCLSSLVTKYLALGVEGLSGGLMDQWISLFKSGLETFISSLFY